MEIQNRNKTLKIDQLSIAKQIAKRLGISLTTVIGVIEMDQRMTIGYCKRGYRVHKNNFASFIPSKVQARQFKSPLFNETYEVPEKISVSVRLSKKFRDYVSSPNAPLSEDVGSLDYRE